MFASWVWVRPRVLRLMAMVSSPGNMGAVYGPSGIFFSEFNIGKFYNRGIR
jgi:hypothetical protein